MLLLKLLWFPVAVTIELYEIVVEMFNEVLEDHPLPFTERRKNVSRTT